MYSEPNLHRFYPTETSFRQARDCQLQTGISYLFHIHSFRKKHIVFFALLHISLSVLFVAGNLYAQLPVQEWLNRYPDSMSIFAGSYAMALDDSENVYVTGFENNNSTWNSYCTIKYSPAGARQWTAYYYGDNSGGRTASAIAVDKAYNVYVTGYSYRDGSSFDFCTIKYDLNGTGRWIKYYDGPVHGMDQAQKIAVDNTGNIYVTGFSSAGGTFAMQIVTVKYSSDGRELWVQRYGHPDASTYANDIVIDANCSVYITGANYDSSLTVKYDSSGILEWARSYAGNFGGTQANSIAMDPGNNIIVTGYSNNVDGNSGQHFDCFVIKYSSSGAQQWSRRFNPDSLTDGSIYMAHLVCTDIFGDIYVSGSSGSMYGTIPSRFCTVKYSNSGMLLWNNILLLGTADFQAAMCIDSDNNVYVTGRATDTTAFHNTSAAVLKYSSGGDLLWSTIMSDPLILSSMPYDIKVSSSNNIYITGKSTKRDYNQNDIFTVKYSQPIGIHPVSSEIPKTYKLSQNYPNPFNPSTFITFDLPGAQNVKIIIYDVTGRQVMVLFEKELKPGKYTIDFDGSALSSGVYFYTLDTPDFIQTKKMVLLK